MVKNIRKKITLFFVSNLIWVILIATYLSFSILHRAFFNLGFIERLIYFSIPLGFIVLAETVCLMTGVFDISVGQMTGLITMLSALLILNNLQGVPGLLLVFLPLIVGAACGMINGFLVGIIKLNPFLATLGTYLVFMGAKLEVSGASTLFGLPESYIFIGSNIYATIALFSAVFLVLYYVINKTTFGHHVYAIGGNPAVSQMLGINKNRIYFLMFMLSGILCGFAALVYTGLVHAASPTVASNALFMALAGAVLAGVSLSGGRGSLLNVLGGILFIQVVEAGLTMLAVSVFMRQIFFGLLVIFAIIVNRSREKLRDKLLRDSK